MPSILAGNPSFTLFVAAKTAGTQPEKILHFGNSAGTAGQVLGMAKNGGYYFNGGGELSFPSVQLSEAMFRSGYSEEKPVRLMRTVNSSLMEPLKSDPLSRGPVCRPFPHPERGKSFSVPDEPEPARSEISWAMQSMHEVMLFSGSLTDFAIRRMEGYLAHKWGSNARLVAGHPFRVNSTPVWWIPVDFT